LVGLLALLSGCAFDRGAPASSSSVVLPEPGRNVTAGAVAHYEPGRDYFPAKAAFRHATQLAIAYHGHYKRVRLVTNGVGEEYRFVFVQRGTPTPPLEPDDVLVHVPIERYSLGTFRYGAVSEALDVVDRLVGFGNHTHVTTPSIRKLFDEGRLQRNFDLEAIANRGTEAHFNWY
jgi:iron complex transport system substrate-binding protein